MSAATLPLPRARGNVFRAAIPWIVLLAVFLSIPLLGERYWQSIATRAAIYWILVSGLNLIVGFAGQLAIGYVSLLTIGAYVACVASAKLGLPPFAGLALSALVGSGAGLIVGLPALRLRTFYFAMTTLGFATIVTQVALAWTDVTGGGIGLPATDFPSPFDSPAGFYLFCLAIAALATWLTANVAHSRIGRSLVTLRDAEVAAESLGIAKGRLFATVFLFSGALAGISGALFASLQSYITPDAFTFDLSVLFFIAILVGGRGSILGPLLGTILLTALPEIAAPLVAWSTFLYAALLLVIVLAVPGGIAALLDFANRKPLESDREVRPRPELIAALLHDAPAPSTLELRDMALHFGGVRAVDGLNLVVKTGETHGLIGPNGSGKTTTLNIVSGFYPPTSGTLTLDGAALPPGHPQSRAPAGIARTFQTPRIVGEASVIDNVMAGGAILGRAGFVEAAFSLPRQHRDEAMLRGRAFDALRAVGLEALAAVRCDRLQHSELRFLEIARALMLSPRFLLLDEPAAGLAAEEIRRLGELVKTIARLGTGVLLVEHHADLIFDVCDRVTVLNLGRELAAGTPAEIREHKEVVSAYLGG